MDLVYKMMKDEEEDPTSKPLFRIGQLCMYLCIALLGTEKSSLDLNIIATIFDSLLTDPANRSYKPL